MGSSHFLTFLKRVLSLSLIYSISRLAFYYYNPNDFASEQMVWAFLEGIRFDLSALLYINIPFLLLLCVKYFISHSKVYKRIVNIVFYTINIPFIILNNIDIVFYAFNLKRSTADFFDFITYTDFTEVYLNYVWDYWTVTVLTVLQITFLLRLKQLPTIAQPNRIALAVLIATVGLTVLGLRGGTQLKPIKPINAGVLSAYPHPDLIVNTPFMMLHTYKQNSLQKLNYFDNLENTNYSRKHQFQSKGFSHENVVVIILESFSKEFVGYYNKGEGFTPFLDSLLASGLAIQNAYSNGLRSIEALPAITASIPSLMSEAFITSPYANNRYPSLASILKDEGYNTSFFHGGKKGTMGFYEFSKKSGFTDYYGKHEYGNDADSDNNWGIYDEPFFQFFAQQLDTKKAPFFSVFFSLTSHPPYEIPAKYNDHFPKGQLEIHESIAYSDNALREFFKTAQTMDWFENTLFVITADHSSALSNNKNYKNKLGRYSVPMLFWKSDKSLKGQLSNSSQHIDIFPTTMELLGYDKEFFSFGKSILQEQDWAITFLKNEYLMITKDAYLTNRDEVYTLYKDKNLKEKVPQQHELVNRMKAIKQGFNNALITNQMRVNEN